MCHSLASPVEAVEWPDGSADSEGAEDRGRGVVAAGAETDPVSEA
jgi:hypothetical protein